MFKVGSLEIPFEMVAKSKTCIVNNVAAWYDYKDGKRSDNLLGYAYDCVLPRNGFNGIRIKVEKETSPSVTMEMIAAAGGSIEVEPVNFVAKVYVNSSGQADLSAKASAVVPVKKG
jgi:hypothetical protein